MNSAPSIDVSDLMLLRYGTGTSPGAVDCYALARRVLARAGVNIPESPEGMLAEGMLRGRELLSAERAAVGDVVVVRGDLVPHLGVMVTLDSFVHVTRSSGVVLAKLGSMRRLGAVDRIIRPIELEKPTGEACD